MCAFSYKKRILSGLFLVLSSLIPLLSLINSITDLFSFTAFSILGILFSSFLFKRISLKFTSTATCICLIIGSIFIMITEIPQLHIPGIAMVGISAGITLLCTPCVTMILWFGKNTMQIGIVWSLSIISGMGLLLFLNPYPFIMLSVCFLLSFCGSLLLRNYPLQYKDPYKKEVLQIPKTYNQKYLFLCLLIFFSSATIGLIFNFAEPVISSRTSLFYIICGSVFSPVAGCLFIERKGVLPAFMVLFFASAICASSLSFTAASMFWHISGVFLFGGLIPFSVCLYAVLYFYLFGCAKVSDRMPKVFIFLPSGIISGLLIPGTEEELIFITFLSIFCSFFSLFSSWKHRLTLLKSI